MDQNKKYRKVLRTTFTKSAKELEELLSAPEGKVRLIVVTLEILKQKYEDLRKVDSDIYQCLLESDESEADLLAEIDGSEVYLRKFTDVNTQAEDFLQKPRDEPGEEVDSMASESSVGSRSGRRKFKLPTLELKKFDGNIRNWLPFWSQFQKIHNDPDIDLNDKVEYLVQCTLMGSRARQLVDSFPVTGDNYGKMVDCLLSRFGRDDLQIEVYVRELLKLVINNTSSGNKRDLSLLYDNLETQLRALETLGTKSDNYAAMLFPLVESCLPSELLRVWQRIPEGPEVAGSQAFINTVGVSTIENRLNNLMHFLKKEVDNEQHISLAVEGFDLPSAANRDVKRPSQKSRITQENFSTAMGLINSEVTTKCLFCQNSHDSTGCFKAQKLTYEQKRNILAQKGACFRCLKIGHQARKCRGHLSCLVCSRSHVSLMCPTLSFNRTKANNLEQKQQDDTVAKVDQALANSSNTNTQVFLQTLRVKMTHLGKSRHVRALIDTGSQKSYILKATAKFLGYQSKGKISPVHELFGGSNLMQNHDCYDVELNHDTYSCTFEALDQAVICNSVSSIFDGPWTEELRKLNIEISDSYDSTPIELLIGSDIAGKLYTGRRHILNCNLVAIETLLGWTLMEKIPVETHSNLSMISLSLFVNNAPIANLWELDVLGINDPMERKTRDETALAAKKLFLETISVDTDGRYEVRLPWLEGHPALPSNYHLAKSRLDNTVKKITKDGYFEAYDQVFQEWLNDNIIEEVVEEQRNQEAHYLPHRPVIKPSSITTKIRPVFDASAREKDSPSLNQCLEKGVNLIELIPAILLRFRQQKFGVTSDISKAFLQISVHPKDRDFLRFLWYDKENNLKVFRHRRVVFGINSSPFLLGASLKYHLSKLVDEYDSKASFTTDTVKKLSNSFYVDNCVTSVASEIELKTFIKEANMIMAKGKFDLRGWEFTHQVQNDSFNIFTVVLGIKWNKLDDTLSINQDDEDIEQILSKSVTKRLMLSQAQRIFDPIGYSCPVTILPKLWLQKTWEKQLGWDTPVDEELETLFRSWIKQLSYLNAIKIPRWINAGTEEVKHWTFHTFCDASKEASSAVVFLRGIRDGRVFVHLLAAKSRVAPIKKLSIPRLELMAAVIGVRPYTTVKESLNIEMESFFWSDSTTVLSWIRRPEEWSTFVWNRVSEIRKLSHGENWHHVPGRLNPADLPSRGCLAKQLLESRWWEGPQ
ncbi:uncharacterized protein [Diabrotica undecimpunctata]|uniref:uncharacterized protein n=1 Tax=Diabrotica undecimpunctata TaxID=50387 RepID=UPI003B63A8CD